MNTGKLIVLLMAFVLPAIAFGWALGDIDGSGKSNVIDVQKAINVILGFNKSADYDADTNQDGVVNAKDVQLVITSILDPALESLGAFSDAPVLARFDLNLAAETTDDRFVTLDFACVGTPTEYLASEQADFLGAAWETYVDAANFLLSPGNGPKTVYFKLRNEYGESLVGQDSIELAEAAPVITEASAAHDLSSRDVQVLVHTSGTALDYMVSESLDFAGAAWQTYEGQFQGTEAGHSHYSVSMPFTLSSGNGDKTLYVKARNDAGESEVATVTTTLDEWLLDEMLLFSVRINGGLNTTTDREVRLSLVGTGTPLEYIASETPDFLGAEWKAYTSEPRFLLSAVNGLKTVYVQVRNDDYISPVQQASITLAEPAPVIAGALVRPWPVVSRDISATIYCRYTPLEYMLSESSNFSGAIWKPCNWASLVQNVPTDPSRYTFSVPYTLSPGGGSRQLYLKLRNNSGESAPATIDTFLQELKLYSFAINGGAEVSSDCEVRLNIDCIGASVEYMASETPDFQGAEWKPFVTSPAFTFSAGDGERTVYLKLRDGELEVSASDTITLEGSLIPKIRTFNVNYNTAQTSSQTAQLVSTCTMEPTEYMASESVDFTGAAWQPYATVAPFVLSSGGGVKTVYFKVRNEHGESVVVDNVVPLQAECAPYVLDRSWPNDFVTSTFRHVNVTDVEVDSLGNIYVASGEGPLFPITVQGDRSYELIRPQTSLDVRKEKYYAIKSPTGVLYELGICGDTSKMAFLCNYSYAYSPTHKREMSRLTIFGQWGTAGYYIWPPTYGPSLSHTDPAEGMGTPQGTSLGTTTSTNSFWNDSLKHVAVDAYGNYYGLLMGRISKVAPNLKNELLAFNTGINEAGRLAVNSSGEMYVVYTGAHKVNKYSATGTLVKSWGQRGSANGQFFLPKDIELDAAENVYIADYGNNRIQVFSSDGTFLRSWPVSKPLSVGLTPEGDVYVGTTSNLYKFSGNGELFEEPGPADFAGASGIAIDKSDNLYVSDLGNRLVKEFDSAGDFVKSWSPYLSEQEATASRQLLAVSELGKVYVSTLNKLTQYTYPGIEVVVERGQNIRQFATDGLFEKTLAHNADSLAISSENELLTLRGYADGYPDEHGKLYRYSTEGNLLESLSLVAFGRPVTGGAIAVDPMGNIAVLGYVTISDTYTTQFFKFNAQRQAQWMVPSPFNYPKEAYTAMDAEGNTFVASETNIVKFDQNGTQLTSWGGPSRFAKISGIAIDSVGRVYVADSVNSCIQRFVPE